jgi:hypothetical protein
MPNGQDRSLVAGQFVVIYTEDAIKDEPLHQHLLRGRIEAVDEHGVWLRPFAADVDSFQDYGSFVPWAIVSLATVVTPEELPQMREVLNEMIRRGFQEAAQFSAERGLDTEESST